VLGAWGAAQATATGLSIAIGGGLRDVAGNWGMAGKLGTALVSPAFGYACVYMTEIIILFATLIALAPLVRVTLFRQQAAAKTTRLGLADFPN
jgi:BCD family chlorophyll transporter-like MFS transporter